MVVIKRTALAERTLFRADVAESNALCRDISGFVAVSNPRPNPCVFAGAESAQERTKDLSGSLASVFRQKGAVKLYGGVIALHQHQASDRIAVLFGYVVGNLVANQRAVMLDVASIVRNPFPDSGRSEVAPNFVSVRSHPKMNQACTLALAASTSTLTGLGTATL